MRFDTIRLAVRHLARHPGPSLLAVAAIALGIGATTAVFSLVSAVLLRPLPYPDAEGIYAPCLTSDSQRMGMDATIPFSYPKLETFREAQRVFSAVGAYADDAVNLPGDGTPERVGFEYATPEYLPILGVRPLVGRLFNAELEGEAGGPLSVLLSYELWQRRFGGDTAVVGRTIALESHTGTIVGVLPRGFSGLTGKAELWLPVASAPTMLGWDGALTGAWSHWLSAVARIAPGVDAASVAAATSVAGAAVAAAHPEPAGFGEGATWGARARTLAESRRDPALRRALVLLLVAVCGVLLVACANLAGLQLARAARRGHELAVHAALGANRRRMLGRLLAETSLLAAAGGALGVALARSLVTGLLAIAPVALGTWGVSGADLDELRGAAIDPRVLLFALGVTGIAALLTGLAPAWIATATSPAEALRRGGGSLAGASGHARHGLRRLLVVAQTSAAIVLLVSAGLLVRSLAALVRIDPGFDAENVVTLQVVPSQGEYDPSGARAMHAALLERIGALPGVLSATTANCLPVSNSCNTTVVLERDGAELPRPSAPDIGAHNVGVGHFRTLRTPLLAGREFEASDREGAPRVIVLNETAAKLLWPGEDPIGHRLGVGMGMPRGEEAEVVGVVADVRYEGLEAAPKPQAYLPDLQNGWASAYLMVRTAGAPLAMLPALRTAVHDIAPTTPVLAARTLDEQLARARSRTRFAALLLTAFAVAALALAALGVFGVLAQMVAERRRELGVRMALGADARRLERLVLGHGFGLALAGVGVGLPAAWLAARALESLLFEVTARDPWTFATVPLFVLAAAALACWLPARRAAALDPATVLRAE